MLTALLSKYLRKLGPALAVTTPAPSIAQYLGAAQGLAQKLDIAWPSVTAF